jgi:hypothetical protein
MTKGSTNLTRIVVAEFITDIKGAAARLAANERHLALSVPPVTTELEILADVQILSAVVGNVLQNAFNLLGRAQPWRYGSPQAPIAY